MASSPQTTVPKDVREFLSHVENTDTVIRLELCVEAHCTVRVRRELKMYMDRTKRHIRNLHLYKQWVRTNYEMDTGSKEIKYFLEDMETKYYGIVDRVSTNKEIDAAICDFSSDRDKLYQRAALYEPKNAKKTHLRCEALYNALVQAKASISARTFK